MAYTLIVSDAGDVMLQSDIAFPAEVGRLEYYKDSQILMIGYVDASIEPEMIPTEIDPTFTAALTRGGMAIAVYVDENKQPVTGYEIPIISIG